MAGAKLFISYKRSVPVDEKLANALRDAFVKGGHEVFIDVSMRVGTDWVAEIDRRIQWCDFLIVLLSEDAAESEMVQAEVRLAHQRRRGNGRPKILPVRVVYTGPLGYELDAYLGRLQYVIWRNEGDTSSVITILERTVSDKDDAEVPSSPSLEQLTSTPAASAPPADNRRPRVSEDPRVLLPPGGTIRLDDSFYVQRGADRQVAGIAAAPGRTLVIKAPRQMGKSSLLIRYLAACKAAGKQFAFIDFQSFSEAEVSDLPSVLKRIAQIMLRQFKLPGVEAVNFPGQIDFTYFVEDKILSAIAAPIVIAMDEADRLLGKPFQADFFSMLRHWHNERAHPASAWENVDIAIVIATEPYLLIASAAQSPFNVTPAIEPEPFGAVELGKINAAYGNPINEDEQTQLFELLSGHPYLTRLAFYRLVSSDIGFADLIRDSASAEGPFGEHLRARMFMLQQQPDLLSAMRRVVGKGAALDVDPFHRLHAAGLVRKDGNATVPANMLYARFFGQLR